MRYVQALEYATKILSFTYVVERERGGGGREGGCEKE